MRAWPAALAFRLGELEGALREDGLLLHPPPCCPLAPARPSSTLTEAGPPPGHPAPSSLQPRCWPPSLSGPEADSGALQNILWNDCMNSVGLGQFPPLMIARVSLSQLVAIR